LIVYRHEDDHRRRPAAVEQSVCVALSVDRQEQAELVLPSSSSSLPKIWQLTATMDEAPPPLTADGSRRNFCAWVAGRSALRAVAETVAKRGGKRGLCCTVWILSRGEQRRPASYQWEKGGTFIAGRNAREVRLNERAGRRGSAHGALSSSGSIGLLRAFPATAQMRPSRLADSRSVAVSTGSRLSCGFADVLRWQRRKDCVLAAQYPALEALAQHSIGEQNAKRVDARTTYAGGREDHIRGWTRGPHTRVDARTTR